MDQTAGATSTLSCALGILIDTADELDVSVSEAHREQLQDCLTFGIVLDEHVAHITATWRVVPVRGDDEAESAGGRGAPEKAKARRERESRRREERARKRQLEQEFRFVRVEAHALYLEEGVSAFLRRIESLKGWMVERWGAIEAVLDGIEERVLAMEDE